MSLIRNKKANFNYEIVDKIEAGIQLTGQEVKSIRAGQGNIDSAFVVFSDGELELVGMNIPPYQPKNTSPVYDRERTRKLLVSKKEIRDLITERDAKKLTLFPVSLYNKGTKIKVEIALGRGKKVFDKRETIKKRDVEREMRRVMK